MKKVQITDIGVWYADSTPSARVVRVSWCRWMDHEALILVLSTANCPDDNGPLRQLK